MAKPYRALAKTRSLNSDMQLVVFLCVRWLVHHIIIPYHFYVPSCSVTIGFTQTEYSVMEGGTVDVTVSVMEGTPSGDVVVTVMSHDGTASML